jgi:hypothetical protein
MFSWRLFEAVSNGTLTPFDGLRFALGILLGTCFVVLLFVGLLMFAGLGNDEEKPPWPAFIPGLDMLWVLAAIFFNWKECPEGRRCVYAGTLCGLAAIIVLGW